MNEIENLSTQKQATWKTAIMQTTLLRRRDLVVPRIKPEHLLLLAVGVVEEKLQNSSQKN